MVVAPAGSVEFPESVRFEMPCTFKEPLRL